MSEPMIATTKGNMACQNWAPEVSWHIRTGDGDFTKVRETYVLNGEVVRETIFTLKSHGRVDIEYVKPNSGPDDIVFTKHGNIFANNLSHAASWMRGGENGHFATILTEFRFLGDEIVKMGKFVRPDHGIGLHVEQGKIN